MRRLRGAFERISSFEALWHASRRARRGKRRARGAAIDSIFYGDMRQAAFKALGLN